MVVFLGKRREQGSLYAQRDAHVIVLCLSSFDHWPKSDVSQLQLKWVSTFPELTMVYPAWLPHTYEKHFQFMNNLMGRKRSLFSLSVNFLAFLIKLNIFQFKSILNWN